MEDNPSYPSFGIRNQVYGNVLYNEVGVDSELTSFFGILILIVYKGVFVGYRGYEVKDLAPLFPFGYGISYTTFEYSNLQHSVDPEGIVLVSFTIKNTGTTSESFKISHVPAGTALSLQPVCFTFTSCNVHPDRVFRVPRSQQMHPSRCPPTSLLSSSAKHP